MGPLGTFGLVANTLKISGFALVGFNFVEHAVLIALIVPGGAPPLALAWVEFCSRTSMKRYCLTAFRLMLA